MLDNIKRNKFLINVLKIASGSTAANIILLLASPFLTRIYTPVEFAALALFTSVTSVLYVSSTGRYELALMLPDKEEDAINILVLSMILPIIFAFLVILILVNINYQDWQLFEDIKIEGWFNLIPLSIILYAWHVSLLRWNSRKMLFKTLASSKVAYGATGAATQVGMGYVFEPTRSIYLIVGQLLAYIVSIGIYAKRAIKDIVIFKSSISLKRQLLLAKKFVRFPLYLGPSGIINFSTSEVPTFLLLFYYSPEVTGFYVLARRVLLAPMSLISDAIGEVFFQQVTSSQDDQPKKNKKLLLSIWKNLLIFVLLPTLLIMLYSEEIFAFIFGDEWSVSGEYAAILAPAAALRFIIWPTRMMLQAASNQLVTFIWFSGYFVMTILIFVLVGDEVDPRAALTYFSVLSSFMYVIYAVLTYIYLRKDSKVVK
jgi:O-antigen/teichoic acid export membrane protein